MPTTSMSIKCHICTLLYVQIWDNFVSIYALYEITAIKMWPEPLVCIHFTLLEFSPEQICLQHCTCVSLNFYCSLYIDPTLLHIPIKTTKTLICHATLKYVPATYMPFKLHINAKYPRNSMCIFGRSTHINLVPSMM